MSNPSTLQAATQDRKARLAQLKSLQRKQPPQQEADDDGSQVSRKRKSPSRSPSPGVTGTFLSGRNYDAQMRGPKLGFESQPEATQPTIEARAAALAGESRKQQEEEAQRVDQTVDLFKLQPKKPTWDLKRHLDKKLEVLNVRTDNAIARMVRERVQKAQSEAKSINASNGARQNGDGGDSIGMEGATLVEATREMEKEEAQEDSDDVDDVNDTG